MFPSWPLASVILGMTVLFPTVVQIGTDHLYKASIFWDQMPFLWATLPVPSMQ